MHAIGSQLLATEHAKEGNKLLALPPVIQEQCLSLMKQLSAQFCEIVLRKNDQNEFISIFDQPDWSKCATSAKVVFTAILNRVNIHVPNQPRVSHVGLELRPAEIDYLKLDVTS